MLDHEAIIARLDKLDEYGKIENLQKGVMDLEDFSREIAELLKKG